MNTLFFDNFTTFLANNDFYVLSNNTEPFFIKEKNSICYIVANISYKDIVADNNVLVDIQNEAEIFAQSTGNYFSKFIFLQLVYFDEHDNFDENILDIPFYPDQKNVNIIWGIDLYGKKIIVKNNQPTKLLDIEKYIKSSLNSDTKICINKNTNYIVNKTPMLTYISIIIISLIYSVTMSVLDDTILKFAVSPYTFENMEIYRLFTSMFLHSSFGHLISNMFALYIFGVRIERYIGRKYLVYTFIIGGICSATASALLNDSYSLGASGAIFALEGFLLYFSAKKKIRFDGIDFYVILTLSLSSLLLSFLVPNIDNIGHIGGFISGIILGIFMYKSYSKNKNSD